MPCFFFLYSLLVLHRQFHSHNAFLFVIKLVDFRGYTVLHTISLLVDYWLASLFTYFSYSKLGFIVLVQSDCRVLERLKVNSQWICPCGATMFCCSSITNVHMYCIWNLTVKLNDAPKNRQSPRTDLSLDISLFKKICRLHGGSAASMFVFYVLCSVSSAHCAFLYI